MGYTREPSAPLLIFKIMNLEWIPQSFRTLTLAVFTTVKETKSRLCRHMRFSLSVMGLGRHRSFDKRPNQSKQKVAPKGVGGTLGEGEGVCQGSVQKFFPSLSAKS